MDEEEKTFEEQFPSLEYETMDNSECWDYNESVLFILKTEVQKHCLDKQRVEEAIDKICYCKFVHEGEYCDEEICKNQLLKKELGLE